VPAERSLAVYDDLSLAGTLLRRTSSVLAAGQRCDMRYLFEQGKIAISQHSKGEDNDNECRLSSAVTGSSDTLRA
jgi:hypothetical protein